MIKIINKKVNNNKKMSQTRSSGKQQTINDKIKRLKKAVDDKSMKVMNFIQNNDEELSYNILGSQGNFYDVKFTKPSEGQPKGYMTCTCPDHAKHHSFCKHIYLVYIKVFKLMPDMEITSNELTEMQYILLKNNHDRFMESQKKVNREEDRLSGYRFNKDDECSICFDIFGENNIYGCHSCKNCFHQSCINALLNFSSRSKCPMCRGPIQQNNSNQDEDQEVQNLADQIRSTFL